MSAAELGRQCEEISNLLEVLLPQFCKFFSHRRWSCYLSLRNTMTMGAGTHPLPPLHSSQAPPSTPRVKRNLVRKLVEQFNEEARLRDRDGQLEHPQQTLRPPYITYSNNSRNGPNHLQPFTYVKHDTVDPRIWPQSEVGYTITPPPKPHRHKVKAVPSKATPTNCRVMYHHFERADENDINEDDRPQRVTPTYFFGQNVQNNTWNNNSSLASNSSGGSLVDGESSLLSAKLVRRADKRVTAHQAWGRNHSPEAGRGSTTPTRVGINGTNNGIGRFSPTPPTIVPIRVQIEPNSSSDTSTTLRAGREFANGGTGGGASTDRRKSRSRSFGGVDAEPRRVYFSAQPPRPPSAGNGEVITYAEAVADIPPPPNQRVSRTVQRNFSMLSPWAPRKPKTRVSPPSQNSSAPYSSSSSRSHSPALVNITLNGNGRVLEGEPGPPPTPKEKVKVRRRHSMPKGFLFRRKKRPQ